MLIACCNELRVRPLTRGHLPRQSPVALQMTSLLEALHLLRLGCIFRRTPRALTVLVTWRRVTLLVVLDDIRSTNPDDVSICGVTNPGTFAILRSVRGPIL
jgi:hypothetical protein